MKLHFHPFELQLRDTFKISHGQRNSQKTLVVELNDGTYSGFGEAAATQYYGVKVEDMIAALEEIRSLIESSGSLTPEALWEH